MKTKKLSDEELRAEIGRLESELKEKERDLERRRMARKVAAMAFDHDDVIITDPGYLIKSREAWSRFCDAVDFSKPYVRKVGRSKMLFANTIFGDWYCQLRAKIPETAEDVVLGTFAADSGTVCAVKVNKTYQKALERMRRGAATVLTDFTGEIRIVHSRGVCWVEGEGMLGNGKVRFKSRQIG